jgi:hypothetical protein
VTAGVDEDTSSHGDVLANVGIEGGEEAETFGSGFAGDLSKEGTDLFLGVILVVELGGETQGLLGDLPHEVVEVPVVGDGSTAVHAGQKFL